MLRAGFAYFADNPDYVRLVRREAIDGGAHLGIDLAAVLRPMFELAADYFEREMAAGTFRQQDAQQLLITGYGALLSYFSDAPILGGLAGDRPARPEGAARSARTTCWRSSGPHSSRSTGRRRRPSARTPHLVRAADFAELDDAAAARWRNYGQTEDVVVPGAARPAGRGGARRLLPYAHAVPQRAAPGRRHGPRRRPRGAPRLRARPGDRRCAPAGQQLRHRRPARPVPPARPSTTTSWPRAGSSSAAGAPCSAAARRGRRPPMSWSPPAC